jgi:DNA primase
MGILDEDVARVRDATDLVALVGERVALKRVGRRFSGLCPFHAEKTASFSINPELGVYHCHGCHESGDAITFLRKLDGLDFVEAVERLAARAGITLRYDTANAGKDRQRKQRLTEAVAAAVDFYHHLLLESREGGMARNYLRGRGFDGDAARQFVLGWAPDGFDALSRHLNDLKFSRDDIVACGLAFVNRAQKAQDFFRGRLMFPIYDRAGDPVGFGGRLLAGEGPKYKNTAETVLYHKSRLLYGLNWSKAEIGARDQVVICEGYTDVMGMALAGVPTAVATCGTALAEEHIQLLKGFTRRFVLAYDADSAGQDAAARWYQWEQKYDVEVRVAALPAGLDPGDLWREDPDALRKAVEDAARFMEFKIRRILASADLGSPEGRARAAEALVPVLREHPSEFVREQYIQTAVGSLDEMGRRPEPGGPGSHAWFKEQLARPARPAPPREPRRFEPPDEVWLDEPPEPPRQRVRIDPREEDVLRWAMHRPELVADWLHPALFADPLARAGYEALAGATSLPAAIEGSEGDVRALLERLAVEDPENLDDAEPETIRARLVVNTVEPAAERLRRQLVHDGDDRAMAVKVQLDAVRGGASAGWASGEGAAMQLVRWISEWTPTHQGT